MSEDATLNEPPGEWTAAEAALIAEVRALAPNLRAHAPEAERLRRLPDETEATFRRAGFYRILQPARYGGLEAPAPAGRPPVLLHATGKDSSE